MHHNFKRAITYRGARLSTGSLLSSKTSWSNHSRLSRRTSGTSITTRTTRSIFTRGTSGARGSNNTLRGEEKERGVMSSQFVCLRLLLKCNLLVNAKSILTTGPAAPTLPAAPGKPVRPWPETHTVVKQRSFKMFVVSTFVCVDGLRVKTRYT